MAMENYHTNQTMDSPVERTPQVGSIASPDAECDEALMNVEKPTSSRDESKVLSDEFFNSATIPSTCHEEWLLRTCSQLMNREATVVSVMERNNDRTRNRRGKGGKVEKKPCPPTKQPQQTTSLSASDVSTERSTATGKTLWSESC